MNTTERTVDATVEPVDLATAKLHLRETLVDTANDQYITSLITVARQEAERRMERTLLECTWLRTLDGFAHRLALPMGPVIGVDWVKYVDDAGDLQTLDPSAYLVTASQAVITPAWGTFWPTTRCQPGAVTVQYKAGYGTSAAEVPLHIRQWILLAIGDMYQNRERSGDRPLVPHEFASALLRMADGV